MPFEQDKGRTDCSSRLSEICKSSSADCSPATTSSEDDRDEVISSNSSDIGSINYDTTAILNLTTSKRTFTGTRATPVPTSESTIDNYRARLFVTDPEATPQKLFKESPASSTRAAPRWVGRDDKRRFLIYTDGCCLEQGKLTARAGCAFVYHSATTQFPRMGSCTFRLEGAGPTGQIHPQTSIRAELRAAIACLQFRVWNEEGASSLVIATDSEYVVKGMTDWIGLWLKNGWKTSAKRPVANKDLWQLLLEEVTKREELGFRIFFWLIPKSINSLAYELARKAAIEDTTAREFSTIFGALC